MKHLTSFIDGVPTHSASTGTMDLVDPATEQVYATSPISDAHDIDLACEAAQRAFSAWSQTPPRQRQLALLRIADEIEARAEEFADVESQDTGKPRAGLAAEEVEPVCDELRFFAGAARVLSSLAAGEYRTDYSSVVRREPIGVIAQVTPWNYPLSMAIWKIAPAIAAGNTVVLKPSETTPQSALLLAEVCAHYLPAGVLNVVLGDRSTGELLVQHPTPQMVSITGSVRAGQAVARTAAATLKRVHLELGGKAPSIVFEDADIAAAVAELGITSFYNGGQDCTAPTRILVHRSRFDEFVSGLVDFVASHVRTGPPSEEGVLYGPLNSADHLSRVHGFIERLPDHATVIAGGARQGSIGYYYPPTIVTGVRQQDEIVQDEVFGPVITIQVFDDEAAAVVMANDVRFGLASSIWTTDVQRAQRVSSALDFGVVWINAHLRLAAEMPHGGFKQSGYGKDLSAYGLEEYTRLKHVMSHL